MSMVPAMKPESKIVFAGEADVRGIGETAVDIVLVYDNEWCTSVAYPALPGKREGCTEIMHPSFRLHLAMNPVT